MSNAFCSLRPRDGDRGFCRGCQLGGGRRGGRKWREIFSPFFKYPKIPSDIDERRLSIQTNENGTALIFISPPPPPPTRFSSIVDRIDSILLLSYIRKCIFIYWKFEKILGTEVIFHEWNPTKQICKYRTTIVEKVISPGKFLKKISATLSHVVFPPIFRFLFHGDSHGWSPGKVGAVFAASK